MDDFENGIKYLMFYLEQIKLQREFQDKWFRYYLLIIGSPFALMIGVLQLDSIKKNVQFAYSLLALLSIILFILGILFFLMYVRQRLNTLVLVLKMDKIEQSLLLSNNLTESSLNKIEFPKRKVFRYGADFYISCMIMFINSIWITSSIVLIFYSNNFFSCFTKVIIPLIFIGSIYLQAYFRNHILTNFETTK